MMMQKRQGQKRNRWLLAAVLALALTLAFGAGLADSGGMALARSGGAESAGEVRVIIENATFTDASQSADGEADPPWTGRLLDTTVEIDDESSMMSAIIAAAAASEIGLEGAESGYISSVNGLAYGQGQGMMSGWMGTLNDWFVNFGFDFIPVADGDVIRLMYSNADSGGEDLGGDWNNNDKSLADLTVSAGLLTPDFAQDTPSYTLTLPAGGSSVAVTPTAANKNFQVRIGLNGEDLNSVHWGARELSLQAGDIITVSCGDSAWPTMNDASGVPAFTYTLSVAESAAADNSGLEGLIIHTGTAPNDSNVLLRNSTDSYDSGLIFSPETMEYTLTAQLDTITQLRFRPQVAEEGAVAKIYYHDGDKDITWNSGTSKWANCLIAGKNTFTIKVTPPSGSANPELTYSFNINCLPTLTGLSLDADSGKVYLDKAFSAAGNEYIAALADTAASLTVNAMPRNSGYSVAYNGMAANPVAIGSAAKVDIVVTVGSGADAVSNTYTVSLDKRGAYTAGVSVTPGDAIVSLYDPCGAMLSPAGGQYGGLLEGLDYSWTAVKYGYIGQSGMLSGSGGLGSAMITAALLPADPSGWQQFSGDWPNFRGNDFNMGLTASYTPRNIDEAALKWAVKYGSSTPPIILNGDLYIAKGTTVARINKTTGEMLKESEPLAGTFGFALNPITYGGGLIYVHINNGRVQALRADTLESVWVSESLGDQTLTPITYHNGYIYTGTWLQEEKIGAYFCISITDEDPSRATETKKAAWKLEHIGGFYWAGAYATDDYVIFGSDDGSAANNYTESAVLYSVEPATGRVIDTVAGIKGDIRSTIAYDQATDRVYFTTKGGVFAAVKVNGDGSFDKSSFKTMDLGGPSTGTPLVYDGVAFLGVSGSSQFSPAGHSYKIIDVAGWQLLDTVDTIPGYVQTSALLSTAYAADSDKVYVYLTYNYEPGGIYVLEYDQTTKKATGSLLFDPTSAGAKAYCICSLVCDSEGNIYYKNDSGYLMAVGSVFPITASAAHGLITVQANTENVSKAAAGTQLTVTVTANIGWEVQQLTLNGNPVSLTAGKATVSMPAGGADFVASYVHSDGIIVRETQSRGAVNSGLNLSAAQEQALLAAVNGGSAGGLAAAADSAVRSLAAQYPDRELKIDLYLDITVSGVQISGSAVSELILDISPAYALYLDGAAAAAASGAIGNSQLSGRVTVSLPIPGGMTVGEHTRILHNGEYLTPAISNGMMTFSVSGFSPFTIIADAKIAEVKFYLQGGGTPAFSDKETVAFYPDDRGDKLPVPTRKNYTFRGWYDDEDGGGRQYTKVAADLPDKLYAVWEIDGNLKVTFRLIGDWPHDNGVADHDHYVTWIKTTEYMLPAGGTVYDLFVKAMKDAGLSHKGASGNYVSSIQAPKEFGSYWLSEFTNGPNSGWMYTVNDGHPNQGLKYWQLEDGDEVIWHYVDDYTLESSSEWSGGHPGYLKRWLEAEDISPAQYLKKYGDTHLILSVGQGGSVEPDGDLSKYLGKNITFYFYPDAGYRIKDVAVDGVSQGAISSYTYRDLTVDSRIKVTFELIGSAAAGQFPDVPEDYWAAPYISSLAQRGVITGSDGGLFHPHDGVTRAQFVTMLARLSGEALPAAGNRFPDVNAAAYYAQSVAWASGANIVTGYGDNSFKPAGLISREEIAVMLYRYAAYQRIALPALNTVSFTDGSQIKSYASQAVSAISSAAIVNGYTDGSFRPAANASRAEAAKMMYLLDALR